MTELQPGTWGVSHGSGFLGDMIRAVEKAESKSPRFPAGDDQAAWAGHVFVYVGSDRIVQAEWPAVVLSPVTAHADALWAVAQPLTPEQRTEGVKAVMALVGTPYDAVAYAYYLAKLADLPVTKDFAGVSAQEAKVGPICSGVMIREQQAMGVPLGALNVAAIQDPDWVPPAGCLRWGLDNNWMDKVPA